MLLELHLNGNVLCCLDEYEDSMEDSLSRNREMHDNGWKGHLRANKAWYQPEGGSRQGQVQEKGSSTILEPENQQLDHMRIWSRSYENLACGISSIAHSIVCLHHLLSSSIIHKTCFSDV